MKKVLIFTESWWGACKMLTMYLKDVVTEVPIEVVDIDENQELPIKYGVRGVPTLLLLEDGKEVKRLSGAHPSKFLENWIND